MAQGHKLIGDTKSSFFIYYIFFYFSFVVLALQPNTYSAINSLELSTTQAGQQVDYLMISNNIYIYIYIYILSPV